MQFTSYRTSFFIFFVIRILIVLYKKYDDPIFTRLNKIIGIFFACKENEANKNKV